MEKKGIGLLDGICPVCKKNFVYRPEYVYTIPINGKRKHVCSWACVIKYEKEVRK